MSCTFYHAGLPVRFLVPQGESRAVAPLSPESDRLRGKFSRTCNSHAQASWESPSSERDTPSNLTATQHLSMSSFFLVFITQNRTTSRIGERLTRHDSTGRQQGLYPSKSSRGVKVDYHSRNVVDDGRPSFPALSFGVRQESCSPLRIPGVSSAPRRVALPRLVKGIHIFGFVRSSRIK